MASSSGAAVCSRLFSLRVIGRCTYDLQNGVSSMAIIKFNDEVLYSDDLIVQVERPEIEQLKKAALLNPRRRIRLCAHRNVDSTLHEMLIVHTANTYVRPHKHLNKIESFHVIEG